MTRIPMAERMPAFFMQGDYVRKVGGFAHEGYIVAVAEKRDGGGTRFLVEDARGMLHVFRGEQLELAKPVYVPDAQTIREVVETGKAYRAAVNAYTMGRDRILAYRQLSEAAEAFDAALAKLTEGE